MLTRALFVATQRSAARNVTYCAREVHRSSIRCASTLSGMAANRVEIPTNRADWAAVFNKSVPLLEEGKIVAVPTDTIYGVACLAQSNEGIKAIYDAKGRDSLKPIAICVPNISSIATYAEVTVPHQLLEDLLPGPVTVVLQRSVTLNPHLNPGTQLVGIRIPDSDFIVELTKACKQPLALTSANLSGARSALAIGEFKPLWPKLGCIFDGGEIVVSDGCRSGSTVVDLSVKGTYRIIRPGSAEAATSAVLHKYGLSPRRLIKVSNV